MLDFNISVPIAQRKVMLKRTSDFQNLLQITELIGGRRSTQSDGFRHFGNLLELAHLKQSEHMSIGMVNKELIFDENRDYQRVLEQIKSHNQIELEKIKNLSLSIELMKSKMEKVDSMTQEIKSRQRKTKNELELKFKVSPKSPFFLTSLVSLPWLLPLLCLRRESPSPHQEETQWREKIRTQAYHSRHPVLSRKWHHLLRVLA